MTVNVRHTEVYAFATPPRQIIVRDVEVYAFHTQIPELPRGVTGKDAVFNMIMALALQPFTKEQLVLSEPRADSSLERNSAVSVSPGPGVSLSGSTDFHYRRLSLGDAFLYPGINIPTASSLQTVHALLPAINAKTGWVLTTNDLIDGPTTGTQVTLIASDKSYFFTPGSTQVVNLIRS